MKYFTGEGNGATLVRPISIKFNIRFEFRWGWLFDPLNQRLFFAWRE